MYIILLFLFLASLCVAQEHLVTTGVYRYNVPPKGESSGVFSMATGTLTTGGEAPVWPGDGKGPKQVKVVFDFGREVPLDRIALKTREPSDTFRTDFLVVEGRASTDEVYRTLHPMGKGTYAGWRELDAPLGGRPVRFVRVIFGRRHNWIATGISDVRFYAKNPAGDFPAPEQADFEREFNRETLMIDRYGQFVDDTWPGKIVADEDFLRDLAEETEALKSVPLKAWEVDTFGGFQGKFTRPATGFFRLEKVDGVWWFITPEGNPYFMSGISAITPSEWGYSTGLLNKDGSPRQAFQELPDKARYPFAYFTSPTKGERVSFLLPNLHRKYGPDYQEKWVRMTRDRLLDWGFNANAKWDRSRELGLPYINVLWPAKGNQKRIRWASNPFDPWFPEAVENGVREFLINNRDDPYIIGHTFESEVGWTKEIVGDVLRQKGDQPAKRAFLEYLSDKTQGDDEKLKALLGVDFKKWEDVLTQEIKIGKALEDHFPGFISVASKKYYSIVSSIIRKYDPNHLFLGSALTPGWQSSPEWETGAVGFVDALSFDLYTGNPEWINRYTRHDVPILLLEYGFVCVDRGMGFFHVNSRSQRERGKDYRRFIEPLVATPQFVGAGWFLIYDQAITGRQTGGVGERFNFGFLNQQDQPYREMIDEVKKTNARLYDLHSGKVPPVSDS